MRVRIKDIAEKANVSTGTVDRVLHNRGEVSDMTRNKILEIIDKLNYQPDILARTLASRRSYRVAIAIPRSTDENEFWQEPLVGMELAISEIDFFGFGMSRYLYDQFSKSSFESVCTDILHDRPDALVFAPVFQKESLYFLNKCRESGIRVILINSMVEGGEYLCYIGQDSLQSGMVAGHLMSYGLSTDDCLVIINIAADKDNYRHIANREEGFMSYFRGKEELRGISLIRKDLPDEDDHAVYDCLRHCWQEHENIKGIFVTNSRVYKVAGYLAGQNGLPQVRLIGYDLIESNVAFLRNEVIDYLISQKPKEQGYQAIMSLFNNLILDRAVQKTQHIAIDIITRENLDYYNKG